MSASPIKNAAPQIRPIWLVATNLQHMELPPTRTPLLTYGLYPLVVGGATLAATLAVRAGTNRAIVTPLVLVTAIAICMLVEWRHPLDRRWSMTARTLGRRDLPFIATGLVIERLAEIAVVAIAQRTVPAAGFGPIGRLPVAVQVVTAIAVFDFAWYCYHRTAHHQPRLWRVHGAHHTPSQLYVLMHGVFHPFDEIIVRFVLALAVFRFVGFTPAATFIALVTIGTVGIISHLNADIRLWALNHLLIGPETHRYHHSANHDGNYGTVTSIWDQVFHTFIFEPLPPTQLGLADPTTYPDPERFLNVVVWPLRRTPQPGLGSLTNSPHPIDHAVASTADRGQ
jgi:sterol desaturase/sphingolipid hydroxylase (fatty acid hydroxylase superfamily)